MQYKVAFLLLFAALCMTTKSDSDSCGLNDTMQGTWIVLTDDFRETNDRVVVDGDNIEVTLGDVTREFQCIDKGLYYGEYLWESKDVSDHYLCVLKTDIGRSIVKRTIKTHTGDFNAVAIPENTDPEWVNLCADEVVTGGLNLKKQQKKY